MHKPRVSVILSSYNHADFIGESIESILGQTFSDFELIIIDDCSSDDSWEVINSYKDPRIIAIRNEKNLGVVIRPEIIDSLKGEYFAIAHCDDKWEETKLEKQVNFLDKNLGYGACFTLVKPIDEDGEEFQDKNHFYYSAFNQKNRSRLEWLKQFFYHGNVLCHPSVMLRTSIQKKYQLYAFGCAALPDEYRWIKICLHDNIYVYQEQLTMFRVRKNEMNSSGDRLDNVLRAHFEEYVLLSLYLGVLDFNKDDFLKVFPTAKKYLKQKSHNNYKYVFARLLIDMGQKRHYQLYGLKLLWEMMQNPSERIQIEQLYNFKHKDFIRLSGQIDTFGLQGPENTMSSVIFYDTGEGFKPDSYIAKNVYVNGKRRFYVEFDLPKNKKIRSIRLDLNHGSYDIYRDLKIVVNGRDLEFKPLCAEVMHNKEIKFKTHLPQILVQGEFNGDVVKISGEMLKRDYNEIDKMITNRKSIHKILFRH